MTGVEARRASLIDRVAALTEPERRALAVALDVSVEGPGGTGGTGGGAVSEQLVACITSSGAPPTAEELNRFLEDRLPEYMIPARYVLLEGFPRNRAGKLDRSAIDPERGSELRQGAPGVVPPRDEIEARLVGIWKEVLGIDEISVHDDFFEIGGDSLLSIRAISRAGRAGIAVSPKTFFDSPTIARIAAEAGRGAPGAEQRPVSGRAPVTPIQEWFFERVTAGRDHWNQSLLLRAPAAVDRDALTRAVTALVTHHDALRLRFVLAEDGWRQEFTDVPGTPPVRIVDLSAVPPAGRAARIEAEADAEHASLDLREGRLFRVVLFQDGHGTHRVLLVAHHLLVDAVSWGIILDDLSALVAQAIGGAPLRLPPKTSSALAWAEGLVELAAGPTLDGAAAYWLDRAAPPSWVRVPCDVQAEPHENRMGNAVSHSFSLTHPQTTALLDGATNRLGATPQELLVASVLLAWSRWTGRPGLQLDIEGHGRGALGELRDVSRTVGWFTSVFPLRLELPEPSAEAAVASVRQSLEALPLRGAAHGLLRYLAPDPAVRGRLAELHGSELLFNYLGSVDALLPPDSPLELASEPTGRERSPEAARAYLIEINARVEQRQLTIDIEYCRAFHHAASIAGFAHEIETALERLSAGTSAARTRFELSDLDQAGLDRVADLLAEIDDR